MASKLSLTPISDFQIHKTPNFNYVFPSLSIYKKLLCSNLNSTRKSFVVCSNSVKQETVENRTRSPTSSSSSSNKLVLVTGGTGGVGNKLVGEVSRLEVAEACIQTLDIDFTEGQIYEINSVPVSYLKNFMYSIVEIFRHCDELIGVGVVTTFDQRTTSFTSVCCEVRKKMGQAGWVPSHYFINIERVG